MGTYYQSKSHGLSMYVAAAFLGLLLGWVLACTAPANATTRPPSLSKASVLFVYDSVRVTTPYTIPVQPDGIALDSALLVVPCATQGCDGVGTTNQRVKRLSVTPGTRSDVTNIPQPGVGVCFAGNIVLTIYRKGDSKSASTPLQYCRGTPPLSLGPSVGPATADSIP